MRIGVDYYPEHWDKALWQQDADLMQKTGVKVVRLAEFAWCRLEPQEGVYDFAWLDEAVAMFKARGIDVVLCTPTSCPPLWLYEKHPDTIMVGADGTPIKTGIRGHRCVSNPTMVEYTKRKGGTYIYSNNPEQFRAQHVNQAFMRNKGLRGEVLLHMADDNGLMIGTGSACSSNAKNRYSRVILACGLDEATADGFLRLSFSSETNGKEIEEAANILNKIAKELKERTK